MAEDNKIKATKKKVSKKKTAKNKVTRKKVAAKTVVKKAKEKKVAKKVVRKKPATKKAISLKADSPELDSFASHAAKHTAKIDEASVSLEPELNVSKTAIESKPAKKEAPKAVTAEKSQPALASTENTKTQKVVATENSQSTLASTANPKTQNATDSSLKKPVAAPVPANAPTQTKENSLLRLVFVILLFAGVSFYIRIIFEENHNNQPVKTVSTLASVTFTKDTEPASTLRSDSHEKVASNSVASVVKTKPELKPLEKGQYPALSGQSLSEKQTNTVAISTKTGPPIEKETFPPPPRPAFLNRPLVKQPLPDHQMEMIKKLFAPEYYR